MSDLSRNQLRRFVGVDLDALAEADKDSDRLDIVLGSVDRLRLYGRLHARSEGGGLSAYW